MISISRPCRKRPDLAIHRLALALALSSLPIPLAVKAEAAQIFSQASPWNLRIPATAVYSSTLAAQNLPVGLDAWDQANYWTIPGYTATASDPLQPLLYNAYAWYKVYAGEWLRFGNSKTVEQAILASSSNTFPYPGNVYSSTSTTQWTLPPSYNKTVSPQPGPAQFRFNAGMAPAKGADGHMTVAQPDGSVVETYASIVLSSGQVVALSYAVTSPTGLGDGWQNGQTASMLPSYAGLIQDDEIAAGVKHAMAISVPATLLAARAAYPAYAFDRDAATGKPPYGGSIPMGGRLALPPSVSVDSLRLYTAEGKAIAAAAKTYGFIVVDRGGSGITVRVRPNSAVKVPLLHTWSSKLQYDLNAIFAKVREVTFPIQVAR